MLDQADRIYKLYAQGYGSSCMIKCCDKIIFMAMQKYEY